jgi:hypothetical protein
MEQSDPVRKASHAAKGITHFGSLQAESTRDSEAWRSEESRIWNVWFLYFLLSIPTRLATL